MINNVQKRNTLRHKNGLRPITAQIRARVKKIYLTQWVPEFEQLMRNRLAMGMFRYAPLSEQLPGSMDSIGSIKKRIVLYEKTGNDEILVDIANIAMVEFKLGAHPKKHFESVDDGEHTKRIK